MLVVKRDGRLEEFDYDKVKRSIKSAIRNLESKDTDIVESNKEIMERKYDLISNGFDVESAEEIVMEDYNGYLCDGVYTEIEPEFADSIADKVEEAFAEEGFNIDDYSDESNEEEQETVTTEDIQEMISKLLINSKYPDVGKEYITNRENRNNVRNMSTELMRSMQELTFGSASDVEDKRENANIDGDTAMGTMLKYGSNSAKVFNLQHMMSADIAQNHKNGDIHIHDLDFLTLTETCVSNDTTLRLRIEPMGANDFSEKDIRADWFDRVLADVEVDTVVDVYNKGWYLGFERMFTRVKNCVRHSIGNKKMLEFRTKAGNLKVTDNHVVKIIRVNKIMDIEASEIKIGDFLVSGIDRDCQLCRVEDIVEVEYTGYVYDFETESHYFNANNFVVHNCCQIDLEQLFKGGFNTGHGSLREPGEIRSYAALACIAIQSNQNDQHGGQSVPCFDVYLAPGVAKSLGKNIAKIISVRHPENSGITVNGKLNNEELKDRLKEFQKKHRLMIEYKEEIEEIIRNEYIESLGDKEISLVWDMAIKQTEEDTHQAMEAVVHNLNSMHSRAGSQVPFSSLNFGTDTTPEGRMVSRELLIATEEGLGDGETAIFPISIFKLKEGVNYNPEDPNYDLFKLACKVSAKRLFPNFSNIDAPYNLQYYKPGDHHTEVAYMGCVKGDEVIVYKFNGELHVESFENAWLRVSRKCGVNQTVITDYIDFEVLGDNKFEIYDSNAEDFVECKKLIKNPNRDNWKLIRTNGRTLVATEDHPLPIVGKGRTHVRDIKIGDKIEAVYVPFKYTSNNKVPKISANVAWLMGILFNGNTKFGDTTKVVVKLKDDNEKAVLERIKKAVNELNSTVEISNENNNTTLKFDFGDKSTLFREYYESEVNGNWDRTVNIPSTVFEWAPNLKSAFIAGMFELDETLDIKEISTDNKYKNKWMLSYTFDNREKAIQTVLLAQTLGCIGDINLKNLKLNKHTKKLKLNRATTSIKLNINSTILREFKTVAYNYLNESNNYVVEDSLDGIDSTLEILDIQDVEINECSYDVETVSDRFDVSGIKSHNCRTRVMSNVYDPTYEKTAGRGNLSFTSINLPRLAIRAMVEDRNNGETVEDYFFRILDEKMEVVHRQLLERFAIQCRKHPRNFPFLMLQGIWRGSKDKGLDDDISDILKNGTLTVGFIGIAECLKELTGKHHGESEESQKLGLKIVKHMRDMTDKWSEKEKLNYSVIATPAEGLSGRFVRMDRERYGKIPGVTDRNYYTNSFHVPVYYPISAFRKADIEAPYHSLCNGGHISYIELDGDPSKNLEAFETVVRYMHDKGIGYFAINHPVDRDPVCGFVGIIDDVCPRCGRHEGEPMTEEMWQKIKGYPSNANADHLGTCGCYDEENDRLPNNVDDK